MAVEDESKIIIFREDHGTISFIVPTPECLQTYTLKEIAEKDVPAGYPYKIINRNELPEDMTWRHAWEIDESELTDGVGADREYFLR